MALQTNVIRIQYTINLNPPKLSPQSSTFPHFPTQNHTNFITISSKSPHFSPTKSPLQSLNPKASNSSHRPVELVSDSDSDSEDEETQNKIEDSELMNEDERKEWRKKIREVINKNNVDEVITDPEERKKKMVELLSEYPLVVNEEDPNWPEDADGWGFNLGQFFDKISIKNNVPKDEEDYDSEKDIVWKDDDYIRPIKEITTEEWEETVFKDISPLVVFVHNRYRRPKENDMVREELEKVAHIFWNCGLPSPRCVAVDSVIEVELVSSLNVVVFPEVLFTKAGKILYREKGFRTADELSKIMGFFYYGAAKPSCLGDVGESKEMIPPAPVISE